jgi:hypothetical protein
MLNWKRPAAAFRRAGKSCAIAMSLESANLPPPWHSAQVLLSVNAPPECGLVW